MTTTTAAFGLPLSFGAAVDGGVRRAVNLSLREVADKAGVSSGRVSQIQRAIEAGGARTGDG